MNADAIAISCVCPIGRYYRRRCLEALVTDEEEGEQRHREELEYTARVAAENPKNYQVWCVCVSLCAFVLIGACVPVSVSPSLYMNVQSGIGRRVGPLNNQPRGIGWLLAGTTGRRSWGGCRTRAANWAMWRKS